MHMLEAVEKQQARVEKLEKIAVATRDLVTEAAAFVEAFADHTRMSEHEALPVLARVRALLKELDA